MKIILHNRGQHRTWLLECPLSTGAAFREMLALNEDGDRQLNEHIWLIEKIETIEPGGLYDSYFRLAQALLMMLNLRTYAEIMVLSEKGETLYRTQRDYYDFQTS